MVKWIGTGDQAYLSADRWRENRDRKKLFDSLMESIDGIEDLIIKVDRFEMPQTDWKQLRSQLRTIEDSLSLPDELPAMSQKEMQSSLSFLKPEDRKTVVRRLALLPQQLDQAGFPDDGFDLAACLLHRDDPAVRFIVKPKVKAFIKDQLSTDKVAKRWVRDRWGDVSHFLATADAFFEDPGFENDLAKGLAAHWTEMFPERSGKHSYLDLILYAAKHADVEQKKALFQALAEKPDYLFDFGTWMSRGHDSYLELLNIHMGLGWHKGLGLANDAPFLIAAKNWISTETKETQGLPPVYAKQRVVFAEALYEAAKAWGLLDDPLALETAEMITRYKADLVESELSYIPFDIERGNLSQVLESIVDVTQYHGFTPKDMTGLAWKFDKGTALLSTDKAGKASLTVVTAKQLRWVSASEETTGNTTQITAFPPVKPSLGEEHIRATRDLPTFREAFDARLAQLQAPAPPPGLAGGPTG